MSEGLEAFNRFKMLVKPDTVSDECLELKETIETELKRLEELEKAFDALLKDDEKTKKLLSKEIEKNRAFEIIKEKGNFISLEYDEYNDKYYIYDNELYMHNEITKEEFDLLKEYFNA